MKPSEKPTNNLDRLFKNKLDEHSIAPSEDAWAKVEAGLSKKNKVGGWFVRTRTKGIKPKEIKPWFVSSQTSWRIAAALFLGALVGILIWSQSDSEKTPALAENKNLSPQTKSKPIEKNPAPIKEDKPAHEERKLIQRQVASTSQEPNSKGKSGKLVEENISELKIDQAALNNKENELNESKPEEKIIVDATTKTEVASKRQKPIKLEFTLEEPSVETVATTNEVKNTGLKKVLEVAREIKQGEGPVLSLREKKNEFFARSFNAGKQKVQ